MYNGQRHRTGINRIQVVLQDEVREKFGYYPMAMVDAIRFRAPHKGPKLLDKYKTPKSHFEVTAVFEYGNEPTLDLGDQCLLILYRSLQKLALRA